MYVQSDTLLLADVFENFQNMYLEIYELHPARFLIAPKLAWQAALKMTKVKLDLLTDINMLAVGMRGGYFTLFIDMQKLITNTSKMIKKTYLK